MNKYVIITWPESQDLFEQPWFDECHLVNDDQGLENFGSSAYFVPENRVNEMKSENVSDFIEMVPVEGGTFQFQDEITVIVSNFMIGKYPVTQKQWVEIMGNNPSYFKGDDLPVESVSWDDVHAFLKKLNERFPGNNFRLPSEAEWEYAARGGRLSKGYEYAGSNNLEEVGWYGENSGNNTHPVGLKKANELGLYDLSGNVWEWCEDNWHNSKQYKLDYKGVRNPDGAPKGGSRVVRGGSWVSDPFVCRSSFRDGRYPYVMRYNYGVRLARH
jgi:formylglycine-generating enzyme required for sulfatase activity